MKKFKITQLYYNGCISPFATISDSIEYELTDNSIIVTITREHYGNVDEEDRPKEYTIKGSFDIDNFFETSTEEERQKYIEYLKETLNDSAKEIQSGYKKEYSEGSFSSCNDPILVEIDGQEYLFNNEGCEDELYNLPREILEEYPIIKLPNKMLRKLLSILNVNE